MPSALARNSPTRVNSGIGHRAHAHAADHLALDRARAAAQRLRGIEDLLGGGQELAARGRQHHAARDALEQRDAELVLERLDLRAHRGLADVQPLGGARQMTELGDGSEAA